MHSERFGRTLAIAVSAVAVFNTIEALSRPEVARRPSAGLAALWLAALVAHATAYWLGPTLRRRFGAAGYLVLQVALIATLGLTGALYPVGVALYAALTAETVVLQGERWSTTAITLGAIVVFAATAIAASDLYRGATAGLLLAVTGVVAHAIAGVVQRRGAAPMGRAAADVAPLDVAPVGAAQAGAAVVGRVSAAPASVAPNVATVASPAVESAEPISPLTPREREVLQALASGARSSEIASSLGITERTVKAHLASIYQKLGVASRAAAVAAGFERRLITPR